MAEWTGKDREDVYTALARGDFARAIEVIEPHGAFKQNFLSPKDKKALASFEKFLYRDAETRRAFRDAHRIRTQTMDRFLSFVYKSSTGVPVDCLDEILSEILQNLERFDREYRQAWSNAGYSFDFGEQGYVIRPLDIIASDGRDSAPVGGITRVLDAVALRLNRELKALRDQMTRILPVVDQEFPGRLEKWETHLLRFLGPSYHQFKSDLERRIEKKRKGKTSSGKPSSPQALEEGLAALPTGNLAKILTFIEDNPRIPEKKLDVGNQPSFPQAVEALAVNEGLLRDVIRFLVNEPQTGAVIAKRMLLAMKPLPYETLMEELVQFDLRSGNKQTEQRNIERVLKRFAEVMFQSMNVLCIKAVSEKFNRSLHRNAFLKHCGEALLGEEPEESKRRARRTMGQIDDEASLEIAKQVYRQIDSAYRRLHPRYDAAVIYMSDIAPHPDLALSKKKLLYPAQALTGMGKYVLAVHQVDPALVVSCLEEMANNPLRINQRREAIEALAGFEEYRRIIGPQLAERARHHEERFHEWGAQMVCTFPECVLAVGESPVELVSYGLWRAKSVAVRNAIFRIHYLAENEHCSIQNAVETISDVFCSEDQTSWNHASRSIRDLLKVDPAATISCGDRLREIIERDGKWEKVFKPLLEREG